MQIANSVLAEFIENFRAAPNSGANLRASQRHALHLKVEVTVITPFSNDIAGTTYTAVTRDLSTSGIGLFQNRPLERDQQLLVTLSRPDGEPVSLRCIVMHCQQVADGIFGVGARIDTVIGQGKTSAQSPSAKSRR